jgi:hypothetical protein
MIPRALQQFGDNVGFVRARHNAADHIHMTVLRRMKSLLHVWARRTAGGGLTTQRILGDNAGSMP